MELLTTDLWGFLVSFLDQKTLLMIQKTSHSLHQLYWDELVFSFSFSGSQSLEVTLPPLLAKSPRVATRIRSIFIRDGITLTARTSQLLCEFTNLKKLLLSYNKTLTDSRLNELSSLVNLVRLDINSSKHLTVKGFEVFRHLTNLKSLGLSDNLGLTDEGVACLTNCTKLEKLELASAPLEDASLKYFSKMTNLTYISLFYCTKITEDGIRELSHLTNLNYLDLWRLVGALRGNSINFLSNLQNLQTLKLNRCKELNDPTILPLSYLTSLVELECRDCIGISKNGFKFLETLTKLKRLDLSENHITKTSLKFLKNCSSLKYLRSNVVRHLGSIEPLKELSGLTYLNISYSSKLNPTCFKFFKFFSNLKELNVMHCPTLTEKSFYYIFQLPSVKKLVLAKNDFVITKLKIENATLSDLDISSNRVLTDKGIILISKFFKNLKKLKIEGFGSTTITKDIFKTFKNFNCLEVLEFGSTSVSSRFEVSPSSVIEDFLHLSGTLKTLDLLCLNQQDQAEIRKALITKPLLQNESVVLDFVPQTF